jgi:DNA-binding CsgD family transcriptional regulator
MVGQEIENNAILFDSYYLLGRVALSQGNLAVAEAYFLKLEEGRAYGNIPLGINDNLAVQAMLSRRSGQLERAVILYSAAEYICPWAVHLILPVDRRERQSDLTALRAELSEAAFSAAWAEGQELNVASFLGLQIEPDRVEPGLESNVPADSATLAHQPGKGILVEHLSPRELEVLRLIASGATNLDIAKKLYIDVGTVKSHNTHIFAKLEVKNRTQAVDKARRIGLI